MDQFYSALVAALTALAVAAGERQLNRFFSRSEKAEASRDADLAIIERVIFEVRDLAKEYWLREGRDAGLESSIVGRLQFLSLTIDVLYSPQIEGLRRMHMAINRFDTACTGGAFQTEARISEPNRCAALELAAYALSHAALVERRKL